jgi:hypothetical protein
MTEKEHKMLNTILKFVPFAFTIFKTFFLEKKHDYKVKHFNQTREKINTIENMIVKVEKKIRENRVEIEELRKQIILSRIINIMLFVIVILMLILMY